MVERENTKVRAETNKQFRLPYNWSSPLHVLRAVKSSFTPSGTPISANN